MGCAIVDVKGSVLAGAVNTPLWHPISRTDEQSWRASMEHACDMPDTHSANERQVWPARNTCEPQNPSSRSPMLLTSFEFASFHTYFRVLIHLLWNMRVAK